MSLLFLHFMKALLCRPFFLSCNILLSEGIWTIKDWHERGNPKD